MNETAKRQPKTVKKIFEITRSKGARVDINFINSSDGNARNQFFYAVTDILGRTSANSFNHIYPLDILAPLGASIVAFIRDTYDRSDDWITELADIFENRMEEYRTKSQRRINIGMIEFNDIPFLYTLGTEVEFRCNGMLMGGTISSIQRGKSFITDEPYWSIIVSIIHNGRCVYAEGKMGVKIESWNNVADINLLPVKAITPENKILLTERGRKFMHFAPPGVPMIAQYQGQMIRSSFWLDRSYRADGRVMVDVKTMGQQDIDQIKSSLRSLGFTESRWDDDNTAVIETEVDEANYWRLVPYLYAYSFRCKEWGRIEVDGLTDVRWRDEAFKSLVLDEEKKEMVAALVEHSSGSFEDLIEGKGGGCVFLLHGPPGQGKTLTAEAIAELLHRPLYSISVGELGTTPDELEDRLSTILDVAVVWNAVVLLDEADIYLEQRDENDVNRNAMVGVFLRLLEYHQGVLFLTTNRVQNIDRAFYSRVSIGIHFTDGGADKRRRIWENLLEAAGIKGVDAERMSRHNINGRQIKNSIRLAQTLARAKNKKVDEAWLDLVIKNVLDFEVIVEKR